MGEHYLAGVGKSLILYNNQLIGVGRTNTQSVFSFSATPQEVRAGEGNHLIGRFFSDSNLNVSITDATFKLEYMALKLGVDIRHGGVSIYESAAGGEVAEEGGVITAKETPVALDGILMAWYKKPTDAEWKMTTQIRDKTITIPSGQRGEVYCIKYFYQNENARSIVIPANFNPSEVHIILIHDLFNAGANGADFNLSKGSKVGRLITDIPRLGLDPNAELSLTPTTSAPVDFGGTALAVNPGDSCEDVPYYGTMTEEIYGAKWEDDVIAIAVENADVELTNTSGKETLSVRVIFANGGVAERKDNKNFTFTKEETPTPTASNTTVGAHDGVIQAGSQTGNCVISVTLTNKPELEPAYVRVQVV